MEDKRKIWTIKNLGYRHAEVVFSEPVTAEEAKMLYLANQEEDILDEDFESIESILTIH